MYCPRCATQNEGDVKFCRSCGTGLETVALALSGKPAKDGADKAQHLTAQDLIEKRIQGASGVTRGAILLTVSFLIAAAMALFMPASFDAPWILIWMVFFGWMAVWGGIEMAYGLGGLLEARARLRLSGLAGEKPLPDPTTQELLSAGSPPRITNAPPAFAPRPRASVTEGTTKLLDDQAEK